MKFIVAYLTNHFITLTYAETGKKALSAKANKFTKNDVSVTFDETKIIPLPEDLYNKAIDYPEEIAELIKNSLIANQIQVKDIILLAEGKDFIKQEYKYTKAKPSHLAAFAELELQSVVNDSTENYNFINYEYGTAYGQEDQTTDLNASLYAVKKIKAAEFKAAFEIQGLKLYKLIPPEIPLINATDNTIVSYDKVVALFSVDAGAIRVCIAENGAVIYCNSFSNSPVSEIACIIASDKNISLEEAIKIILDEGFGIAEECNYQQNTEKINSILDDFSSDFLRNLRMVLLSRRLDLDQIYLSDAFSNIPNIKKYLRQIGFSCNINNIKDSFLTSTNIGIMNENAASEGYQASNYFLYTYILNSGKHYNNNLLYSHNVKGGIDFSLGFVASIIFALATVSLILFVVFSNISLNIQAKNDKTELESEKYAEIITLSKQEDELNTAIDNIAKNKKLIPKNYETTENILNESFSMFTNNPLVNVVNSYSVIQDDNTITLNFVTDSFEDYVTLYDQVAKNEFFEITKPFNSQKNKDDDTFAISVTLQTKKYIKAEKERLAEEEKLEKENQDETTSLEGID